VEYSLIVKQDWNEKMKYEEFSERQKKTGVFLNTPVQQHSAMQQTRIPASEQGTVMPR
jgi:hypothetical protein